MEATKKVSSSDIEKVEEEARKSVQALVDRSLKAEAKFATYTQDQVDKIVRAMAIAANEHALELAHEARNETGRGIVEDKVIKNRFAAESIYHAIKDDKTVGVISEDPVKGQVTLAAPLGVLAAVTPTTNPTSTTIFKSLLAAKTRNTVIFGFHPQAQKSSSHTAKILYDAGIKAGAPKDFILWIEKPSIQATAALMKNPGIASIIATGGPAMVHAALSSGNPSMGVGAGNGAVYVDHTANIQKAVEDLLLSKRFDNGMICATENSVVIEAPIYDEFVELLEADGSYMLPKNDYAKLADFVFNDRHGVNGPVAGMPAKWIAEKSGFKLPADKDVIVFELDPKNIGEKLSSEKLSPLLSIYKAKDRKDGIKIVQDLLNYQGAGHNAAIQIGDQSDPFIKEFADQVGVSRIMVNQPGSLGGVGDIYSDAMRPSLTLGTGSWGKNSLSHNLSTNDLLNFKTVALRRDRPQAVELPMNVLYEKNAVSSLKTINKVKKAFVLTDSETVATGDLDKVKEALSLNSEKPEVTVYEVTNTRASIDQIKEISQNILKAKADTVIALGNSKLINLAKITRYIYEVALKNEDILNNSTSLEDLFTDLQQRFVDMGKRIVEFDTPQNSQLIIVSTTIGNGSEMTPFAKVDSSKEYYLADHSLLPQMVIIDPGMLDQESNETVIESALSLLAQAIESYVSVMASEFTKPWALEASQLIFKNLPLFIKENSVDAREQIFYAAALTGMSSANAFLGLNTSIANNVSYQFNISEKLAEIIAMIPVIKFNSVEGKVKRMPVPSYEVYSAKSDYAKLAAGLGLKESSDALIAGVQNLIKESKITPTLSSNGVKKADLDKVLDKLADNIYIDQNTATNPRQAKLADIKELLLAEF